MCVGKLILRPRILVENKQSWGNTGKKTLFTTEFVSPSRQHLPFGFAGVTSLDPL